MFTHRKHVFTSPICRSRAAAVQGKLQSGRRSCRVSGRIWRGGTLHTKVAFRRYFLSSLALAPSWRGELSVHSHSRRCNPLSGSRSYHYRSEKYSADQTTRFGWRWVASGRLSLTGFFDKYWTGRITEESYTSMGCFCTCGLHIWHSCAPRQMCIFKHDLVAAVCKKKKNVTVFCRCVHFFAQWSVMMSVALTFSWRPKCPAWFLWTRLLQMCRCRQEIIRDLRVAFE